jgi:hypothetical protein
MTAALHQLSQDVYSRAQAAGGLRLFRLRAIMLEYRADLHRLTTQAHSLFADIKRDAKSYFPTARGGASAAAGVPAPVAVRGGPRKKNSGIVFFVSCRDRRFGHKKDTGMLAVCEKS